MLASKAPVSPGSGINIVTTTGNDVNSAIVEVKDSLLPLGQALLLLFAPSENSPRTTDLHDSFHALYDALTNCLSLMSRRRCQ